MCFEMVLMWQDVQVQLVAHVQLVALLSLCGRMGLWQYHRCARGREHANQAQQGEWGSLRGYWRRVMIVDSRIPIYMDWCCKWSVI